MQYWKNIFLLLFSFLSLSTFAQVESHYIVHVGNFVNPKPLDFEKIRSLGFIYTEKAGNTIAVRMGGYTNPEAAEAIAAKIRKTSGDFARVMPLNVEGGQPTAMIQLGAEQANKAFSWKPYLAAGQLYVLLENGQAKILTGKYADAETARANLSNFRNNGFPSAFPKLVNNALLHEVGEFELAGEKRPLIPLDFSQGAPPQKPVTKTKDKQSEEVVAESYPVKTASETVVKGEQVKAIPPILQPKEETAPTSFEETAERIEMPPPPSVQPKEITVPEQPKNVAAKAVFPKIRADVKRNSAYVLQLLMKEKKVYTGSLDGFYGAGTKTAYDKMKNSNRQIQKYEILADYLTETAKGGFNDWEEIQILSAMARDISGRLLMSKSELAGAQTTLNRLYLSPQRLGDMDAKAMNQWHEKLWKGLEGWALQDPLLENIRVGMKVVYYQSYVLLEDYFMNKGFTAMESKALALEALKAVVGYHLDRFV